MKCSISYNSFAMLVHPIPMRNEPTFSGDMFGWKTYERIKLMTLTLCRLEKKILCAEHSDINTIRRLFYDCIELSRRGIQGRSLLAVR